MTDPTQYTVTVAGSGLDTLPTTIGTDVTNLLPYGVAIMAIFIGVSVIPRIVYKFF